MSRTFKDYKIKRELAKIVREKKSGPHKQKKWAVCSKCKGAGCLACRQEGIIYE